MEVSRMKRYIDADKLYADIAKDTYVLTDSINSQDYGMYLIGIRQKIDEAPTVDAEEVVRCGECVYMHTDGRCDGFADFSVRPSVSDFCSYGIRREE